jgi:SAM-dependent methyltransferase
VVRWPIWDVIPASGWCLDLGCGAGRYAYALASRGFKVLGIDLSMVLIREALASDGGEADRDRIQSETGGSGKAWFIRADMRRVPASGPFSLVVSMFTSFGYFADERENTRLVEDLARMLSPGGVVVLDLPNPEYVIVRVSEEPITTRICDGVKIVEERFLNETRDRINKKIVVTDGRKSVQYQESVRLYPPKTLECMLGAAGFTALVPLWGDYEGGVLTSTSPRVIYFGRVDG